MSWYILITPLSDSLKLLCFCWVFMLRIWYKFHVSSISGVMTVWILSDIYVLKWKQPVPDKSTLNSADSPWTQGINWTYIRRSEDVLDVFWTCYVRSIYVMCLRGNRFGQHYQKPPKSWKIENAEIWAQNFERDIVPTNQLNLTHTHLKDALYCRYW